MNPLHEISNYGWDNCLPNSIVNNGVERITRRKYLIVPTGQSIQVGDIRSEEHTKNNSWTKHHKKVQLNEIEDQGQRKHNNKYQWDITQGFYCIRVPERKDKSEGCQYSAVNWYRNSCALFGSDFLHYREWRQPASVGQRNGGIEQKQKAEHFLSLLVDCSLMLIRDCLCFLYLHKALLQSRIPPLNIP